MKVKLAAVRFPWGKGIITIPCALALTCHADPPLRDPDPPPIVRDTAQSWEQCYYIHHVTNRLRTCLRYHEWDSALAEGRINRFRDSVRRVWEAYYNQRPREVYYHRFEADSPAYFETIRRQYRDQLVDAAVERSLMDNP